MSIIQRRTLTIDNGGSELRMIQNSNDHKLIKMEKAISVIDANAFRVKDNIDPFEIVKVTQAPSHEYINLYALNSASLAYSGIDIQLNNQVDKTNSTSWYQQVILGIARDAILGARAASSNIEGSNTYRTTGESSTSYEYVLVTLIPVKEHYGTADCAAMLKQKLAGTYTVEYPALSGINKVTFSLKPEHTGVLPEGAVALTALGDKLGPNDITLIMDMGHISFDLAICRGKQVISKAVMSSSVAGGTLLRLVGNLCRQKGFTADNDLAIDMLNTFKLRLGAKEIDVRQEVDDCKEEFIINRVKPEILTQLELANVKANNIQNIIPIGAIFNKVEGDANPILDTIVEECNLTNSTVHRLASDLRYVNVEIAAKFADKFAAKVK